MAAGCPLLLGSAGGLPSHSREKGLSLFLGCKGLGGCGSSGWMPVFEVSFIWWRCRAGSSVVVSCTVAVSSSSTHGLWTSLEQRVSTRVTCIAQQRGLSNFHSKVWKLEIQILAGKGIWWFSTHVWAQHSLVQISAVVGHNRTCWYPLPWWIELIHQHNRLECLLSPTEAITLKQVYSLFKIYYVKTYSGSSLKPGFLCPFKTLGLPKKSLLSVGLFFKHAMCVWF